MHKTEHYLLRREDFIRAERPDGSALLTHPFLAGEIEIGAKDSPYSLFPKLKQFSERNAVPLSPELERLVNAFGDWSQSDEDTYQEDERIS